MSEQPQLIPETCFCDPRNWLAAFRKSDLYREAWARYFHGRRPADDVSEAELREAFEDSDVARLALIEFARLHAPFAYVPGSYALSTAAAIDAYVAHVRYLHERLSRRATRDEIGELDRVRSLLHRRAAQAMIDEGITSSVRLGRTIARLILVSLTIETYDEARRMI